jgi:hypothetical protein
MLIVRRRHNFRKIDHVYHDIQDIGERNRRQIMELENICKRVTSGHDLSKYKKGQGPPKQKITEVTEQMIGSIPLTWVCFAYLGVLRS